MSKNNSCLVIMNWTLTFFISPVQLRPSPVYPALQVQLYEPWVLTQSAFAWHLCVAEVHSLTSDIKKQKNKQTNKQTNKQEKTKYLRRVYDADDKATQLRDIKINSHLGKKKPFSHIPTFFVSFLVPFALALR